MKKNAKYPAYSLKTIAILVLPFLIGILALAFFTKLSQWKTETTQSQAASGPKIRGYVDRVDDSGRVYGWIANTKEQSRSIQAEIYIDGVRPTPGKYLATITANLPSPDVNKNAGINGNHRFVYQLPAKYQDGQHHILFIYSAYKYENNQSISILNPIEPKTGFPFTWKQTFVGAVSRTPTPDSQAH